MFDPINSIHALNQIAYHAISFAIALNIVAWLLAFIGTAAKAWQQARRDRRQQTLQSEDALLHYKPCGNWTIKRLAAIS